MSRRNRPSRFTAGTITYLPTSQGWLYLATVIDLHSREIVGHAMAGHLRADLVCDAITLATARGLIRPHAVFHSDRGVQYTSGQFLAALAEARIRPSIGRVGSCYDNAIAESFSPPSKPRSAPPSGPPATRHDTTHSATSATTATTVYIRQSVIEHPMKPEPATVSRKPRENPVSGIQGQLQLAAVVQLAPLTCQTGQRPQTPPNDRES